MSRLATFRMRRKPSLSLEPRPGRPFSPEEEQTILPDVIVERDGDDYTVSLNDDEIPSLRIGDRYKDMLSQSAADREVRDYLREKIRGGRFFIRCVQQRQHTLLNIAREIVERAARFLRSWSGPFTAHDDEQSGPGSWRARDDGKPGGLGKIPGFSARPLRVEVFLHLRLHDERWRVG